MELKLTPMQMGRWRLCCSNRTFMELKLHLALGLTLFLKVLIVPLWN